VLKFSKIKIDALMLKSNGFWNKFGGEMASCKRGDELREV
jgi:hypothetical protein